MMCFEEFVGQLKERLTERFCEDYDIQTDVIQKVNGVEKTGLQIRKKGVSSGILVYPEDVYVGIQGGSSCQQVFGQLIHRIEKSLERVGSQEVIEQMVAQLLNYEEARKRLVYRLVQTKRNRELLQDIPHIPYLDLSIIFELYWKAEGKKCTVLIRNSHLEQWGVTVEELLAQARENTPKLLPAKSDSLNKIIRTMTAAMGEEKWEGQERWENQWMYFLSNQEYFHGAAAVLYEGELKRIADLFDSNLIVLPSSVNEVLLLPERLWPDIAGFAELIQEINQNEVEQEEWLSDHPYRYLRGEDRLEAA